MKKKVIVLGAGLVGATMARDLADRYEVTSADFSEEALQKMQATGCATCRIDFTDHDSIRKAVAPFDLVVGAVPGYLGFEMLRAVIEAGKNAADISFFPEDPFALDNLARKMKVSAVVDCGVAPGMGNIILGYHHKRMAVERYECLVGGLPSKPELPYSYRAVFSPIDVIEEYTRPARFVQDRQLIVKEALTDPETIAFDFGRLESWNSDGLRTLLKTMPEIPNMIEKTLRYPGSMDPIMTLRDTGLFSKEPVNIRGVSVRPIDVTARLLFPLWKLREGEEEFTVMRITISGTEGQEQVTHYYDLFDRTDKVTGSLSMARTTGYTCTAIASLMLEGKTIPEGICPPEHLGETESSFHYIMNYLEERGVHYAYRKDQRPPFKVQ